MSVINSMLRDLDRRHAPLPIKTYTQPALVQKRRAWPRSAFALCALIIVAMWSWSHNTQKNITPSLSSTPKNMTPSSLRDTPPTAQGEPVASTSAPPEKSIATQPTPIHKQERVNPNAINDERYQLARTALAQNQPQRAYELLRDNPPPLANATDYHAVLAAVEQQLGHYADASLRYQQLLMLDQNQASWWLGFALSLEGEHRNSDALAAYQRAMVLNALPEAARQYVTARIMALGPVAGQTEVGN